MARISKKNKTNEKLPDNLNPSKKYSVGIYARLSVDARHMSCEQARKNESIETQIEIAKAFVNRQNDMVIFDYYIDIGKTGTNFEREGFERMMRDVRTRKIDCIIVKDLSRFGRNHIETGNYIEKIFPFMGVRFIAVTDHFDSINLAGQNETLGVNLKNLINEMYAKDIAVKVKSVRQAKWEQGSYIGGVAPYGYRAEWVGDKKCLFVEKITSDIVKNIFDLFLNGKNMKEIARWLFEEKIVRPTKYHQTGHIYCQEGETLQEWSRGTIKMILTNPVYTGCLIYGKTCGADDQTRSVDSGELSVKEHTHEAIIEEDIFFKVAERFEASSVYCNQKGYSKRIPVDEDIYADVLYCGDCGSKMKRISTVKVLGNKNRIRIYSYNCPKTGRIDADRCVTKSITLRSLNDIAKEAIRQEFSLSTMCLKDLVESNNREAERIKAEGNQELLKWQKRVEQITKQESEQYLKYRMGELDADCFKRIHEKNERKRKTYIANQKNVEEKLSAIDKETVWRNHVFRTLVSRKDMCELTAEVVKAFIHRIEVYPDCRVKVIFSFKRKDVIL